MWAKGYFVASSRNVTDEIIAEYILNVKILLSILITIILTLVVFRRLSAIV